MAGDWIKMRCELQTHPKIVRILSATKSDKFRVVGGLHAVWSVFDAHSTDGVLFGYTPETLDHVMGWDGFSKAMISVGWLLYDGAETLSLPDFGEHNGQSAKRRAEDQKRKRDGRREDEDRNSVRNLSADSPNESGLEKRREEKREPIEASGITKSVAARGSRLPKDWLPNDEEILFCKQERPDLNWRDVANQFRDYWIAKAGKDGAKTDWPATWRNWVRRQQAIRSGPVKGYLDKQAETFAAFTGRSEKNEYADDVRTIDV